MCGIAGVVGQASDVERVRRRLRRRIAFRPRGNAEAVRRLWQAFVEGAPGLYWSRVWAVYVLIRWCQKNQVVG